MAVHLESRATLPWLVHLRWIALAGQIIALELYYREVWHRLGTAAPSWLTASLVGFGVLSNLALSLWLQRVSEPAQADRIMTGILTLDTVSLTVLLAYAGGPSNPFTIFYLVNIVLAALVLQTRATVWLTILSALCFASLFAAPTFAPDPSHRDAALEGHLHGMWIAFVIAAGVIAYFVRKISVTLARQREQIIELRESAATNARFASLATLAAGAAHELGSPLGTIAVAAHELDITLNCQPPTAATCADAREDVHLIALEVERCRKILSSLSARTVDEQQTQTVTAAEIFADLQARAPASWSGHLAFRGEADSVALTCAREGLLNTLIALINNGLDSGDTVEVTFLREGDRAVSFAVTDNGAGFSADVAARAGEPFFTTKEPGHGMGLGLFLARTFAESSGGRLRLQSQAERGAKVTLWLPLRPGLLLENP